MMKFYNIVFSLVIISLKYYSSKAQMVPALFVFGSSFVDVGNNNYLPLSVLKANFPPYGIDFPNKESTGRFSNGYNTADFINQKLGLPLVSPYLKLFTKNISSDSNGVSFASGGSGILDGTNNFVEGECLPLSSQVDYFERLSREMVLRLGASEAEYYFSESLFLIVIGSNDIYYYTNNETLKLRSNISPQQYVDSLAVTIKGHIKRLYLLGARKFVVPGIYSLGCFPVKRRESDDEECDSLSNSMAASYNENLKSLLEGLDLELPGFSHSYFDTYPFMQNLIQSPATYGFKEVKEACCGLMRCLPISSYCSNRTSHMFWDEYHPTQATASILADAIFDGPPQYSIPVNVRQLVT